MIRDCPKWFQDELTRIGGTNRYGEPLFKLVWSLEPRNVAGGVWADGFVGYKTIPAVPGEPCWALMIWEGPETYGDPEDWEYEYRQASTGLLEMGSFPKYGRYRLLKRFMHQELVQKEEWEMKFNPFKRTLDRVLVQKKIVNTQRMEPTGLILDLMIPMLQAWKRLTFKQKLEATNDRRIRQEKERDRVVKDAMHDCRVRRSSKLVQDRAEIIERGMDQAMRIAAQYGKGMNQAA